MQNEHHLDKYNMDEQANNIKDSILSKSSTTMKVIVKLRIKNIRCIDNKKLVKHARAEKYSLVQPNNMNLMR